MDDYDIRAAVSAAIQQERKHVAEFAAQCSVQAMTSDEERTDWYYFELLVQYLEDRAAKGGVCDEGERFPAGLTLNADASRVFCYSE